MAKEQVKRRDKAEKTECCVCLVFDVIRPALGAREGKMFCGAVLVFEKRAASGRILEAILRSRKRLLFCKLA